MTDPGVAVLVETADILLPAVAVLETDISPPIALRSFPVSFVPGPSIDFTVDVVRGVASVEITLAGEFDVCSALAMQQTVTSALADKEVSDLTFDLKEVTFMDCSGLRGLLDASDEMSLRHGRITLTNVPTGVGRLVVALHLEIRLPSL